MTLLADLLSTVFKRRFRPSAPQVHLRIAGRKPDLDEVMAAIQQTPARFKHPRKLAFADALPRNPMGKVEKNVPREQFGQVP